jgi:hypothetical protein
LFSSTGDLVSGISGLLDFTVVFFLMTDDLKPFLPFFPAIFRPRVEGFIIGTSGTDSHT